MSPPRRFQQVDVFSDAPLRGNPVAVVLDAEGLDDARMLDLARWTNLSETTFVLPPTDPAADYRVRIFTPVGELPFAGHPTLGTAHAWLAAGGQPDDGRLIGQECGLGLVAVRHEGEGRLAFASPVAGIGEVDAATREAVVAALGLEAGQVLGARWLDVGPRWLTLHLDGAASVLAAEPDPGALRDVADVGLVGLHPEGSEAQVEVRAFATSAGVVEDPVTGSLNAGIAQWLVPAGVLPPTYRAAQGARIGRAGRVHVAVDEGGTWVAGTTTTVVEGTLSL